MTNVKYNAGIEYYRGTLDSRKTGQAKRERLISRFRKGPGHQVYPMKMHEGPWSEGATKNREIMKAAQKEAHAIEKAILHPELSTPEMIEKAAEWQQRFLAYKATKKPADKQYATLYTFTYAHLYRELKTNDVLTILEQKRQAKEDKYKALLPQIESLISGETDLIANMANIAAVLREAFGFWWVGFYLVKEKSQITNHKSQMTSELVLGPFQGPVACTRIGYGKGVCGTAWKRGETIIVPNVHEFPGHIACSAASKSEIVIPFRRNNEIFAVLDIDSADFNTFDTIDKHYLEQIVL